MNNWNVILFSSRVSAPALRYETTADVVIRSPRGDDGAGAQRKHKLAADTDRIKR